MGENAQPRAPWLMAMPISRGLIFFFPASRIAMGASMPAAIGDPRAISAPESRNIIHTSAQRRPWTRRRADSTMMLMVPLALAIANSKVIPATIRKMSPGNASTMSSIGIPDTHPPTRKAPAKARMPMLIGTLVAMVKISTRARMEMA